MFEHLSGQHDQQTHGHGGGVGSLSGVNVSKWPQHNSSAKWATKKIEALEKLAADGNWDELSEMLYKQKEGAKSTNAYQKGLLQAQDNLLKMKNVKPPEPPKVVPPPPQIASKANMGYQKKMDAVYAAAQTGDLSKVEAIATNATSKQTYAKKLHAYKQEVLASMADGKPAPALQSASPAAALQSAPPAAGSQPAAAAPKAKPAAKPKAKPAAKPAAKPKAKPAAPTVDPTKLPPVPEFLDANYAASNTKFSNEALMHAKNGDLASLDAMKVPSSPKVQKYHQQLKQNVVMQLNPPPPVKSIKGSYDTLASKVPPKPTAGSAKVGKWAILGDAGGLPEGVPTGYSYVSSGEAQALHNKGLAAHAKLSPTDRYALQDYTGNGYHGINKYLRGESTSYASDSKQSVKALLKSQFELPEGITLSRKHNDAGALDGLKVGHVVTDSGIMSTATDTSTWNGTVQWHMTTGKGVKGLPADRFSQNKGEKEVLLPPNTRLVVTKIEDKGSGWDKNKVVHAVILPFDEKQWP